MKYKTFYREYFGETKEEETIETNDICEYMLKLADELSYPTHDWWVDYDNLSVYDDYGNEYKFEKVGE